MRARSGIALIIVGRKIEVEKAGGDRHRDVHRQRSAPDALRPPARSGGRDRRGGRRRLRSSASARMRSARGSTGLCSGMAEAGHLARRGRGPPRRWRRPPRRGRAPASTRFAASTRTSPQSSAVPRTTVPQPRMPAATRALERIGRGVVGHARGDRGRRQSVLGDGDEQEVEEEALRRRSARWPVIRR